MNSVVVLILGFVVAFIGYRVYAKYVDTKIMKSDPKEDAPEFVRNRVAMQEEHMEEIWSIFDNKVRAIIPLFETEVKGSKMLNRLINHLFV